MRALADTGQIQMDDELLSHLTENADWITHVHLADIDHLPSVEEAYLWRGALL